ncbi:MAG: bifunctional 4'-phosphopantothenoylcysteine decarboxylase/phosphopantothenoylcysteine synthetase, partial [Planctomycetota bacterium]
MRILVTAGGTREYIDPVRFISNASTGKMGYALARTAAKRGHIVTLIAAPIAMKAPSHVDVVNVVTCREMFDAVKDNFDQCDCLIMAAAVSDYAPVRTSKMKMKKSASDLTIRLKPTSDILAWAGKNKKSRIVVGFALEDEKLLERAEQKLADKKLDMIVANSLSSIGTDAATVHIKTLDADWLTIPDTPKRKIAAKIIGRVET